KKYYEENKEKDPRLMEPAYLSFSHITVDTNEQAAAIRQRLEKGEEINELAKTLSVASDAKKGGKAVKFREETVRQQYGKPFFDALKSASEGEIVGPIQNSQGKYEIARHEGSRAPKVLDYEKVKDQIKASLEGQQKKESIEKLINDLREKEKSRYKLQGMFEEKENKNADEKKSEK
ncbi:MAG: peptidyl-prolyl cis-trans isomerase, partial [Phycisphaerales bacterium]